MLSTAAAPRNLAFKTIFTFRSRRYGAIVEFGPAADSMHCPTCAVSTCLICKARSPHAASCRDIISAVLAEQKAPLPPGMPPPSKCLRVNMMRAHRHSALPRS